MTFKKYIARKTFKLRQWLSLTLLDSNRRNMRKRASERMGKLKLILDNSNKFRGGDILLLAVGRDEGHRIKHFIKYYSDLGIDHFLFIDNNSADPIADQVREYDNITLFYTDDSYSESLYGVDWLNALLRKYCCGHWTLTVDLDEYLVYPEIEITSLPQLVKSLEANDQDFLYTPLIDMYPKGRIQDAIIEKSCSPLDIAPYFDGAGYSYGRGENGELWLKGGPRYRIFNSSALDDCPALNKYAFVKWHRNYYYTESTHLRYPLDYCNVGPEDITGALLHFKFISNFKEKSENAVAEKNHYRGSAEYKTYLSKLKDDESLSLHYNGSKKYESSSSLISCGLMNIKGAWPKTKSYIYQKQKNPLVIVLVHTPYISASELHQLFNDTGDNIHYLGAPINKEILDVNPELLNLLGVSSMSTTFRDVNYVDFCNYLISLLPENSVFVLSYVPGRDYEISHHFIEQFAPAILHVKDASLPILSSYLDDSALTSWSAIKPSRIKPILIEDLKNELTMLSEKQGRIK